MRLLLLNDQGTIQLTGDLVHSWRSKVPDYAILSHTWLDEDQEVTFDDLTNGTGTNKAGYAKLRFCVEQAARDDLRYCWVDTCCIRRTNPVEVQNSINSMFEWYRDAAKCYVYLSDVATSKVPWQPAFRKSRWFTRGWTVQELLAPRIVQFFSEEGDYIGARTEDEIQQLIHKITDIPIAALAGTPLNEFEFEERLSWTKNRSTKCAEDKAYSLIGFFGFYMPLEYGEGQETAFQRLRHYIDHYCQGRTQKKRALAVNVGSEQELECLRLLHFPEMNYQRERIQPARETCEWIFKDPIYQKWRGRNHGIFWIKGDPAVGKTVLMKYLVEHTMINPDGLVISFFVNGRGSFPERSSAGVLQALLFSLLNMSPEVLSKLTAYSAGRLRRNVGIFAERRAWTCKELEEMLAYAVLNRSRPLTIFVDALDELHEIKQAQALLAFFHDIMNEVGTRQPQLKICVSSRLYPLVGYKETPSIFLRGKHSDGIAWYIQQKLRALEYLSDTERKRLEEDILSRSQMGFLWAVFMTNSVLEGDENGDNLSELRQRVAACPNGIEDIYEKLFAGFGASEKDRHIKLFQWMLFAQRVLNARELQDALLTSPDMKSREFVKMRTPTSTESFENFEGYITHLSRGLVRFETSNNGAFPSGPAKEGWHSKARLHHPTLTAYLCKKPEYRADAAHIQISQTCLSYLASKDLGHHKLSHMNSESESPLRPYALQYMFKHTNETNEINFLNPDLLGDLAVVFSHDTWFALMASVERRAGETVEVLLKSTPSAPQMEDEKAKLLLRVAYRNHRFDLITALLKRGVFTTPSATLTDFVTMLAEELTVDARSQQKILATRRSWVSSKTEMVVALVQHRDKADIDEYLASLRIEVDQSAGTAATTSGRTE